MSCLYKAKPTRLGYATGCPLRVVYFFDRYKPKYLHQSLSYKTPTTFYFLAIAELLSTIGFYLKSSQIEPWQWVAPYYHEGGNEK